MIAHGAQAPLLTPPAVGWILAGGKGGVMGARENLELIEELQQAARDLDFDRYGQLIAEDAVFRAAGVPDALGGVLSGGEAIVEQLRRTAGASRAVVVVCGALAVVARTLGALTVEIGTATASGAVTVRGTLAVVCGTLATGRTVAVRRAVATCRAVVVVRGTLATGGAVGTV